MIAVARDTMRDDLFDFLDRVEAEKQATWQPVLGGSSDAPRPSRNAGHRARAWLAKCPGAVSGQGGHNRTLYAAVTLLRFGVTPDEALQLLTAWNATCTPPWAEHELRHKVADAVPKAAEAGPMPERTST